MGRESKIVKSRPCRKCEQDFLLNAEDMYYHVRDCEGLPPLGEEAPQDDEPVRILEFN